MTITVRILMLAADASVGAAHWKKWPRVAAARARACAGAAVRALEGTPLYGAVLTVAAVLWNAAAIAAATAGTVTSRETLQAARTCLAVLALLTTRPGGLEHGA